MKENQWHNNLEVEVRAYVTLLRYKMNGDDDIVLKIPQGAINWALMMNELGLIKSIVSHSWGTLRGDELSGVDEWVAYNVILPIQLHKLHNDRIPWGVMNWAALMNEFGGSSAV